MAGAKETLPDELILLSGFSAVRRAIGEKTLALTRSLARSLQDQPELEVRSPNNEQAKRRPGVVLLGSREVKQQQHLRGIGLRQTKEAVREQLPHLFEAHTVEFTHLNVHSASNATFFEVLTDEQPGDDVVRADDSIISEREDIIDVIDELSEARDNEGAGYWNPIWVPAMTLVYAPYAGEDYYGNPNPEARAKIAKTSEIIDRLLPFSVMLDSVTLLPENRTPAHIQTT